jgi:hypothetical protein
MTGGNDGQLEDAFWAALVARSLPSAYVEIVEALRWIDRSLTAIDLLWVFEGQSVGLRIEYRLRQLAKLNAIQADSSGTARGPMGQRPYRLVKRPKP